MPERQFNPKDLQKKLQAGMLMVRDGHLKDASRIADTLKAMAPDAPPRFRLSAAIEEAAGNLPKAYAIAKTGLQLNPDAPTLRLLGARLAVMLGHCEDAIEMTHGISREAKVWHELQWWNARALERLHRLEEAAETLASLDSFSPREQLLKGRIQRRLGHHDQAIHLFTSMLDRHDLSRRHRARACFELSHTCDATGDWNAAFDAASTGNHAINRPFCNSDWLNDATSTISSWTKEALASLPRSEIQDSRPVFIVGLPRSGTSLTEQILTAHPHTEGVGEVKKIIDISTELKQYTAQWKHLDLLTANQLTKAGQSMLQSLGDHSDDIKRITCKSLQMDQWTGLLPSCLPGCRVIFVERNPLDNLLSIYLRLLNTEHHPYSTTLEGLITARKSHQMLVAHWKRVLPCPWMELEYESLINHPEDETRRLVEFLELPWDDQCLSFYNRSRTVMTPSYEQVDKPIHDGAIGRWKHYREHIQPLIDAFPQTASEM